MSLPWETSLFFWHAALLLHRSLLPHGIVCMGMIARSRRGVDSRSIHHYQPKYRYIYNT
jgi:hypothetical protein